MKKLIFLVNILFSINAFSQDEIQVSQTENFNTFLKYNDSILANIDTLYNKFQRSFYNDEIDTFPQLIMNVRSQVDMAMNDYMNTSFDMIYNSAKESFLSVLRIISDFNNQNISKTEEYFNRLKLAKKNNNSKEKETADEQICNFFEQLEKSKEIFLKNYRLELDNLKIQINSEIKK
ncbi:MAG: hypothetical protein HUU47_08250 [Bacteroidetes bacterium]|nr:hypothetical protein [Bacteroidota bacterium]